MKTFRTCVLYSFTEDENTDDSARHTERLPTIPEGTSESSDAGADGALSLICQHHGPVTQGVLKQTMVDTDELHDALPNVYAAKLEDNDVRRAVVRRDDVVMTHEQVN